MCLFPVFDGDLVPVVHDVILENRVYSIKQQVYKGDYDSPKADTRESMWKDDRCYYAGLDLDENGSTEPIVFGISGLKDSAIALEKVNVIGYHNNFDCGMRTYVWDETALDLADKKIRCNSVNPGMIETDILRQGAVSAEEIEENKKKFPLGRWGKPVEIARGIIYLLSDASSWTTGSTLVIDGGVLLAR